MIWFASTLLALAALCVPSQYPASAGQSSVLPGITFVVDTTPDMTPQGPAALKPLGIRVTVAGTRGRVDVVARPCRPALRLGDVVVAQPMAAPGDYYLFDRTDFILVRPASREFYPFRLADASFNYEGRRDGWPAFFRASPSRVDTLTDSTSSLLWQHGALRLFWHLDVVRDTACVAGGCSVQELARGLATIVDAPAAELGVARWFGPAEALADLPGGIARLTELVLRVTTVSSVTGIHRLLELRATSVDAALLTLPPDFRETAWPGMGVAQTPPQSPDGGAKWRTLSPRR